MNAGTVVTVKPLSIHQTMKGRYLYPDVVNPACCYVELDEPWQNLPAGQRVHVHTSNVSAV